MLQIYCINANVYLRGDSAHVLICVCTLHITKQCGIGDGASKAQNKSENTQISLSLENKIQELVAVSPKSFNISFQIHITKQTRY